MRSRPNRPDQVISLPSWEEQVPLNQRGQRQERLRRNGVSEGLPENNSRRSLRGSARRKSAAQALGDSASPLKALQWEEIGCQVISLPSSPRTARMAAGIQNARFDKGRFMTQR